MTLNVFLYDEILADELGHVGHIASRLGTPGRTVARVLYRVLGPYMAAGMPEVAHLFGGELRAELAGPFRLFEMAGALPDRACVVATM
jgi:hypothetical protein